MNKSQLKTWDIAHEVIRSTFILGIFSPSWNLTMEVRVKKKSNCDFISHNWIYFSDCGYFLFSNYLSITFFYYLWVQTLPHLTDKMSNIKQKMKYFSFCVSWKTIEHTALEQNEWVNDELLFFFLKQSFGWYIINACFPLVDIIYILTLH